MLPGRDGFEVATELRRAGDFVPILMLTARGRPEDVLQGFEAGADDYLPKPFELAILLARVRGLFRRSAWSAVARRAPKLRGRVPTPHAEIITFAGNTLDMSATRTACGDDAVPPDTDGGRPAPLPAEERRARPCRARPFSKTSGTSTKTPTHEPSITSSSGSAAFSTKIRRSRVTS